MRSEAVGRSARALGKPKASPRRVDTGIRGQKHGVTANSPRGGDAKLRGSLIELLVVILIIGILAAIALPAFLSQRSKGQDADAKSQARNLVSHVEGFYATEQTYTGVAGSKDVTGSGIPVGAGKGKSTISKDATGVVTRTCDKKGDAACPASGDW